jgi:tRNA threonylcarbamoyladenosine biosynthesis protein TsaB
MSLAFDIPTKGFSTLKVLGVGAAKKYKSNKIAVALDARLF